MRTTLLAAILVCFLLYPATGFGAETGQSEISLGGGAGIPTGDFGDAAKTGFGIGGSYAYYVSPQLAIGVEGNYTYFDASDDLIEILEFLTGTSVDANFSVFQGTVYGKYLVMAGNMAPYIKAGGGLYRLGASVTVFGVEGSDSESNFGFGGGAGVQFMGTGALGGFVEGLYHIMLTEDDSTKYIDLRAGVSFLLGG